MLDSFAYLHFMASVILCRGKFLEVTDGEKTLQEVLPSFPKTQRLINWLTQHWMNNR
jgi:hypothetical protein